jgi:hypothetical protein
MVYKIACVGCTKLISDLSRAYDDMRTKLVQKHLKIHSRNINRGVDTNDLDMSEFFQKLNLDCPGCRAAIMSNDPNAII